MAAQARGKGKVLRIGIIQDGKIVQERLIKAGEPVTIGDSAKSTFVVPLNGVSLHGDHILFEASGEAYTLNFTEEMKGKISSNGAVVALQKLQTDPTIKRKDSSWQLPLSQEDRGKLSIGNITVLFQFVAPPPVQAVQPMQAMDFRPRLMDDDDPVFLGFLAVWLALGAVLAIWVQFTEPREYTMEELPERFTNLVIPPKDVEIPPLETTDEMVSEDATVKKDVQEKDPEPSEKKAKESQPKSAAEAAAAREAAKKDVVQNSALLAKLMGTTGDSATSVQSAYATDEGLGDLEARLAEGGGITTDGNDPGLKVSGTGKGGAVDIGDLATSGGGGSAKVEGAGQIVKVAKLDVADGDMSALEGDAANVKAVVKAKSGLLKACYEAELKNNPNLAGRVEVSWYINAGKPESILVVVNSTGSDALATCITRRIKMWSFNAETNGDVTYPFVFNTSN